MALYSATVDHMNINKSISVSTVILTRKTERSKVCSMRGNQKLKMIPVCTKVWVIPPREHTAYLL